MAYKKYPSYYTINNNDILRAGMLKKHPKTLKRIIDRKHKEDFEASAFPRERKTVKITETELKKMIAESIKTILSERSQTIKRTLNESITKTEEIDPATFFENYASELLNHSNPVTQQAARFMQEITNNGETYLDPFVVEIGGDVYGDDYGPCAGEYEWEGDSCYVDILEWPAEIDSAPEDVKNMIFELVEEYVNETPNLWSIYDGNWK